MRALLRNPLGIAVLFVSGVASQDYATAACFCETNKPVLTFSSPIDEDNISGVKTFDLGKTAEPTLSFTGEVEDYALSHIGWSHESGSGTIAATTDWKGTSKFKDPMIDLVEGDNTVTITARDADGNESKATFHVTYEESLPPPPPTGGRDIVDQKIKITGYTYPKTDRYNIIAYLDVEKGSFSLPCKQDVTITASVLDPDNQQELVLFEDTIPAGSASTCTTKLRAVTSSPDLKEVVLEQYGDTRVYLYVFAEKGTYWSDRRPPPPATADADFLDFVAQIDKTKLRVEFSDGQSWEGWSDGTGSVAAWEKLKPCKTLSESRYASKVELRCNR